MTTNRIGDVPIIFDPNTPDILAVGNIPTNRGRWRYMPLKDEARGAPHYTFEGWGGESFITVHISGMQSMETDVVIVKYNIDGKFTVERVCLRDYQAYDFINQRLYDLMTEHT